MTNCIFDLKTLYRNTNNFSPFKYFTPLLLIFNTACGGGGGGSGATINPPKITAPPPGLVSTSEISNSPGLNLVAASHLYDSGARGRGFRIAVLDSGVDANHEELDGRVFGGGDWQGPGNGLNDPNGHGTHVASIAVAARNGEGIQGIAPDAEVLSYRILNERGLFGSMTGNQMLPSIMADISSRGIEVVNNSWASFYEINDFSSSVIESALNQELNSYRKAATPSGPVLVWAAGNGSDNEVSVRSGLPHYFPELEENWLAVVAVDQSGYEPSYTNRCGVSAAWCITAPGGGDDEDNHGIIGAQAGGGYTLKSGTSMAAPLVSGALSLILEAMPTLSPRDAATRLKETSAYDGLTTAGGCTIETCSEDEMSVVFGHGLINVNAALQPIGKASIVSKDQHTELVEKTIIQVPVVIGAALKNSLKGAAAVVHDDFDNALFVAHLDNAIISGQVDDHFSEHNPDRSIIFNSEYGLFVSPSHAAPINSEYSAQLIEIPSKKTDLWKGWVISEGRKDHQIMFGHGSDRNAIHYLIHDESFENTPFWYGLGLDNAEGFMEGAARGALQISKSQSKWIFSGLSHDFDQIKATAEVLVGQTTLTPHDSSLIRGGYINFDAWTLKGLYSYGVGSLELSVKQPHALRDGAIIIDQPRSISAENIEFSSKRFDLSPTTKERQHNIELNFGPNSDTKISVLISHIVNQGHQKGRDETLLNLSFKHEF